MLRPRAVAAPAALFLAALCAVGSLPDRAVLADLPEVPDQALDRAQTQLDRNDARAAVATLENALPSADATTRAAILDQLRKSYEPAALQAEAGGDTRQAAIYRENLAILQHRPATQPVPASQPVAGSWSRPRVGRPVPPPATRGELRDRREPDHFAHDQHDHRAEHDPRGHSGRHARSRSSGTRQPARIASRRNASCQRTSGPGTQNSPGLRAR